MENTLFLEVMNRIPEAKRKHTLGVIKSAEELAVHYGANVLEATYAGLLHDITKNLAKNEQFTICEKYDIIVDNVEKYNYKLLHAKTASAISKHEYNMNDAVCQAIKYHTTLHREMTLLDKIIYVADYIEENRTFDGVQKARELAFISLDETLRYCLDQTILEILQKGDLLHNDTVNARNYLYENVEV